ncbi:MAG: YcgJ family protein [Burkholderiales bacterium]
MKRLLLIAFLCLASPLTVSAQLKGAVFSPSPGIVCDKKAQFCADDQGISLAYTKEYLGQKAENTMMGRIKEGGGSANYDLTWFAFSNGVDCKTKEKVCRASKHSDKVDAAHTKALFGR